MSQNPRQTALFILHNVVQRGQSLTAALQKALTDETSSQALIQHYVYGVMRYWHRLQGLLTQLLDKPLKKKDEDVQLVIVLGCYELLYGDTAEYAVISESVNLAHTIKKPWAKGLMNAVLRRVQREKTTWLTRLDNEVVTRYSHPAWLIRELQDAYPDNWETILTTNNTHAPMTLCVNAQKGSRDAYQSMLAQDHIVASHTTLSPEGLTLAKPQPAATLPGFAEGWVNVQDEAAQYAAVLLDCQAGMRVLDACAAPGNKTAHILTRQPDCDCLALDCDPQRVESIRQLQQRLGFAAVIQCADATQPEDWWDQKPFDRILLDAPCSGTGVIRRHPDIKYHRQHADIANLLAQQSALLQALWPLLNVDGYLLYVTCTLLPQENQQQIDSFLEKTPSAILVKSQQLLPEENRWDGLYFAKLQKRVA